MQPEQTKKATDTAWTMEVESTRTAQAISASHAAPVTSVSLDDRKCGLKSEKKLDLSEVVQIKSHPALRSEGTAWKEFELSTEICGGYGTRKVRLLKAVYLHNCTLTCPDLVTGRDGRGTI